MSYYSIEDLLTEEYDTSVQIQVAPWVAQNNTESNGLFQLFQSNQTIKIPMWLAYDLHKRSYVSAIVPHFLHVRGLSQILNNPNTNLSHYNAYFYQLGFKILNYYSQINEQYRGILVQVLKGLFLKRFREALVPQADTRDLKSVSMSFLDSLPEMELTLFKRLEEDFITFHRWRQQLQPTQSAGGSNGDNKRVKR